MSKPDQNVGTIRSDAVAGSGSGLEGGVSHSGDAACGRPGRGRIRRLLARPSLAVWYPLLAKGLVVALALASIAWLGQSSIERSRYGAVVESTDLEQASAPEPQTQAATQDGEATAEDKTTTPCVPEEERQRPAGVTKDGRVILNEASAEELTRLRGVGEKRAASIVALRERLGGFRKISDLLRVRGIGWKSLQKLKDHLVLERPPEDAESGPEEEKD